MAAHAGDAAGPVGCVIERTRAHAVGPVHGVQHGVDIHTCGLRKAGEFCRIQLLELRCHLVGNAVELGIDHILFPQLDFLRPTLVAQGEVLQEILELNDVTGLHGSLRLAHIVLDKVSLLTEPGFTPDYSTVRPGGHFGCVFPAPSLELVLFQQKVVAGGTARPVVQVLFHVIGRNSNALEQQVHPLVVPGIRLDQQVSVHDPTEEKRTDDVLRRGGKDKAMTFCQHVFRRQEIPLQRDVTVPAVNLAFAEELPLPFVTQDHRHQHVHEITEGKDENQGYQDADPDGHAVIFPIGTAVQGAVQQVLERAAGLHGRLEHPLFELHQANHGAGGRKALGRFFHHRAIHYVDIAIEAKAPYTRIVEGPFRTRKSRDDDHPHMLRCRRHAAVHEHEVEGVCIVIGLDQPGHVKLRRPLVPAGGTQAPA